MSVGEELAARRRSLGLSLAEISARTKVGIERLRAIEETDISRLPSLVYLKGFVRAYAAEVQLDSDTISARYLDQLDLRALGTARQTTVLEPDSAPSAIVPVPADPLGAFESESDAPESECDAPESERDAAEAERDAAESERDAPGPAAHASMFVYEGDVTLDALAGITSERLRRARRVRASYLRRRIATALIVTSLAALGGYFLSGTLARLNRGRTPQQVRSMSDAGADAGRAARADAATASAVESPEAAPSVPRNTPRDTAADVPLSTSEPVPSPPAPTVSTPAATASPPPTTPAPMATVNGWWAMTNRVESSSRDDYKGLTLGFRLLLEQHGNSVVGTGYKFSENGVEIPSDSRTPMTVSGTIQGDRLALTFKEQGAERASAGRLVLFVGNDGSLHGRFRSDAAQSSGSSLATRESNPRD